MKARFLSIAFFGVLAAGMLCGCKPGAGSAHATKSVRQLQVRRDEAGYRQCVSQPDPVDFHWPRAAVETFCADKFTDALTLADVHRMIEAGQGLQLDVEFDAILDDYFAGHLPEGSARDAYLIFTKADDETGALIDRWLRQSPRSAHALAARGIYRAERGGNARGERLSRDTSRDRMEAMFHWFRLAQPDLENALKAEPRILAASESLFQLAGMASQKGIAEPALAAALKIDPGNFYVRATYQQFVEPRWGGSLEAMDRVASNSEPWLGRNPRLAGLRAMALIERSTPFVKDHQYEDALREYERGLALCPAPHALEFAGRLAMQLHRYEHAVELFSQALRFNPDIEHARVNRARSYAALQKYSAAQVDLDRLLEQSPDDASVLVEYAGLLSAQLDFQGAAAKLLQAHQKNPNDTWVTGKLAWTYLYKLQSPQDAEPLVAQLLEANPRSGAAWLLRTDLLDNLRRPGLREAAENFVRYADASDEWQKSALPRVQDWLAAHSAS